AGAASGKASASRAAIPPSRSTISITWGFMSEQLRIAWRKRSDFHRMQTRVADKASSHLCNPLRGNVLELHQSRQQRATFADVQFFRKQQARVLTRLRDERRQPFKVSLHVIHWRAPFSIVAAICPRPTTSFAA